MLTSADILQACRECCPSALTEHNCHKSGLQLKMKTFQVLANLL